jgi:hypothetical protein
VLNSIGVLRIKALTSLSIGPKDFTWGQCLGLKAHDSTTVGSLCIPADCKMLTLPAIWSWWFKSSGLWLVHDQCLALFIERNPSPFIVSNHIRKLSLPNHPLSLQQLQNRLLWGVRLR